MKDIKEFQDTLEEKEIPVNLVYQDTRELLGHILLQDIQVLVDILEKVGSQDIQDIVLIQVFQDILD